jgi:quercetin 2,3-dioxygenase
MEILTYVLEGTLAHKDSLGTGAQIKPGEMQRMSAGSGISHSEFNASSTEPVHLLQIWILPQEKSVEPSYEQVARDVHKHTGEWLLLASPDGRAGSVRIGQNVLVWGIALTAGQEATLPLPKDRFGWIQIAKGEADLAGFDLIQGDGASVEAAANLDLHAKISSEILFFDLP